MAIITASAFYQSYKQENSQKESEHPVADSIGKSVAALVLLVGLGAIYGLTISGIFGEGPLAHLSFAANMGICGTLGGIELLSLLGIALKALQGQNTEALEG